MFDSMQSRDKIVINCCLWIVNHPIFVVIHPGVHQMILSSPISVVINDTSDDSILVKYPL